MNLHESDRFDWSRAAAARNAADVPQAIEELRSSNSEEDAEAAYRKIDNNVVVQQTLYEASEFTIPCLLGIVNDATKFGRVKIFELLWQFVYSGAHIEKRFSGGLGLELRCGIEIRNGVSQYFYFLQNGTDWEKSYCADLVEYCSVGSQQIARRAQWWLEKLISETENEDLLRAYKYALEGVIDPRSSNFILDYKDYLKSGDRA